MKRRIFTGLLAVALCATVMAVAPTRIHAASPHRTAALASTVESFIRTLNAANLSGNFSPLMKFFTAGATLRQSTPAGQTSTFHGIAAINQFYLGIHAQAPDFQWSVDAEHSLAKNVIMTYDHIGTAAEPVVGRCAHVYVFKNGKIASYDWVIYH